MWRVIKGHAAGCVFMSRRLYRIEYRDDTAHFLTRGKHEDEALILGSFPIAALQTIMK